MPDRVKAYTWTFALLWEVVSHFPEKKHCLVNEKICSSIYTSAKRLIKPLDKDDRVRIMLEVFAICFSMHETFRRHVSFWLTSPSTFFQRINSIWTSKYSALSRRASFYFSHSHFSQIPPFHPYSKVHVIIHHFKPQTPFRLWSIPQSVYIHVIIHVSCSC